VLLVGISASARAADPVLPVLQALGTHGGWLLLAAIGLAAVVVARFAVRRPLRHRRALMEATTVQRDAPADLRDSRRHDTDRDTRAESAASVAGADDAAIQEDTAAAASSATHAAQDPATPAATSASEGSQLFLALHHVDLSIDVLRRHLQQETRPMPAVWLMLLDLARTHGREQTFRDLAQEFHRRFNARMPAWDGFPPDRDEPGLEAYPRLVKEITLAWGTHECRRLLDRLLYDTRSGDRKGFTLNAYNDLVALRRAADAVIDTIEQDLAEEAKVRSAFASANAEVVAVPDGGYAQASPLVRDLESELEGDLRAEQAPASPLEREHPALARMLTREWGNAALSVRLCEMLARGGDGAHRMSKDASDDLDTLRAMAERLASTNGIALSDVEKD
jgi:hypothetical protein